MKPIDFSKALLDSAKLDVAPSGAKARAIQHVAAGLASVASAGSGTMLVARSGVAKSIVTWPVVAALAVATAGVGSFLAATHGGDRRTSAATAAAPDPGSTSTPNARVEALAVGDRAAPTPVADPTRATDVCAAHVLPERRPSTCSHQHGKSVALDLRNACANDVDVFWVDTHCEEVFHARLAPGESFERLTQDGHVWRVRDHATRALLKEFVPQRLPGTPDDPNGAARALGDVVIGRELTLKTDEGPPPICSGAGALAKLKITNERDEAVSVMWVSPSCKEQYWERIPAHGSLEIKGRDADAWRVRDAKTGGVVFDIAPEAPDLMTYVTVP